MVLTPSILRILCDNRIGTAFFIEGDFLLTAAHNIVPGHEAQFYTCGTDLVFDIPVKAEKVVFFSKEEGDIALFRLLFPQDIPNINQRSLRLANEEGCTGNRFQTFGFPQGKEKNGVPYNGSKIDGIDSTHSAGFPQLTLSEPGNISGGYSGAPVYVENKGVVAMILEKGYELAIGVSASFIKKKISTYIKPKVRQPKPAGIKDEPGNIPLPEGFSKKLPDTPYPGLKPFTKAEARIFFGRNRDIATIYRFVNQNPEPVTLLFGQSGVGKSSLLFAGLLPRLDREWEVHYCRRDKDIGLPEQLNQLVKDNPTGVRRQLFILDQVEEIYTNPGKGGRDEAEYFVEALKRHLPSGAKFMLGFRSEYFAQIEDLLKYENIAFNEWFLKPLDKKGILNAIKKPAYLFPDLHIKRQLPETIAATVLENEASHIAPLLQIQMRKLYEAARSIDAEQSKIGQDLYHKIWKKTLDKLLETQLNSLDKPQWNEQGLALDLLHGFTTEQATATSLSTTELQQKYGHIEDFDALIDNLKALELLYHSDELLANNGDKQAGNRSIRLTHDALAPLIRKRYHDSDAPAQRAWRLVESKQPDIMKGVDVRFDQYDIEIIEKGRPFMQVIPENTLKAIEKSRREIALRQAELRDKTAFIFDTLSAGGNEHILQVEHEKAIKKCEAAMDVDIPSEKKEAVLADTLKELAYFFSEAGDFEKARRTLKIFGSLPQEKEAVRQAIDACDNRQWDEYQPFPKLLKDIDADFYQKMKHRYYPQLIDIKGGDFEMGGLNYNDSKEIHPVTLTDFRLAQTPLTYWQYGLYCAAKGLTDWRKRQTPPWGRIGDHPLVLVKWFEAIEYANWLSEKEGKAPAYLIHKEKNDPNNHHPGNPDWLVEIIKNTDGYRLPTEAEWEYAAKGGIHQSSFKYSGSDDLNKVAWYNKNADEQTWPVKSKDRIANRLGLYDMSGNVWEWCWDWYGIDYYEKCKDKGSVKNPMGAKESEKDWANSGRVLRGGSWYNSEEACSVSYRDRIKPNGRDISTGFRLAQGY